MNRITQFFAGLLARVSRRGARPKDPHVYELALGQRMAVVTDFGRFGTIIDRSATLYEGGTEAYLIKRERDGVSEWYPRFSLAADANEAAPTEVTVKVEGEPIKGALT